MDNSQYLEIFIEESKEHLQMLNDSLMVLEKSPGNIDEIQTIFRAAHTLKGMAGSMGFQNMAHLTHEMENGLDLMRNGRLQVTQGVMDVLFQCVDALETQLDSVAEQGEDLFSGTEELVKQLASVFQGKPSSTASVAVQENLSPLLDYTESVIQKANNNGKSVFAVYVTLDSKCVMPGVRAFMVVRAYESIGDIIKSEPSANELEEGRFEGRFALVVITDEDEGMVKSLALEISEVAGVDVQRLDAEGPRSSAAHLDASMTANQQTPGVAEKNLRINGTKSIRVDIERLDALMNLFSEFVIDKTRLELQASHSSDSNLIETVQHLSRVGTDLQDIVMSMRMVTVETVFNRFPRMVRDLTKSLGKKVNFEIRGADTELDRTLVDEIGDPLVHILRNSLDHGLETPEERVHAGKNEMGTVQVSAFQAGNHVFIEVSDDGRGIDRTKVLQKALERGLAEPGQENSLNDEKVFDFLFQPGFSTADKISDISGRGVGLDVVKSKISSLGGDVVVQSQPGKGTVFTIQLPLTLSILQAMMVQVGDEKYAIPLNSIVQIDRVRKQDIQSIQGHPMVGFRGRMLSLISLKDRFSIESKTSENTTLTCVVLSKGEKMLAVEVDEVLGQQEVVLKSLGNYLGGSLSGVSGATILGDGQVALIVDPNAFIR